jgi:large subunit ribosomal protein L1
MKVTKRKQTWSTLDSKKVYTLDEAIETLRGFCSKKFDESLEIAIRLGIDVAKADQNIRGMLSLPNGTGKKVGVAVFTINSQDEAKKAGADVIGGEELIDKVANGFLDFDRVIATPDMMPKMSKVARVLGPKGLMPNPKTGTVTMDVAKAVKDAKAGKVEFRADKQGMIHCPIGKSEFSEEDLIKNYATLADAILRAKPSSAKGTFVKSVYLATTMGPGLKLDPKVFAAEVKELIAG